MRFVISAYGNRFAPFLAVCLRSLYVAHPHDDVCVLFDDVRQSTVDALRLRAPRTNFVNLRSDGSAFRRNKQRVPAKLQHWVDYLLAQDLPAGEHVIFLDADMIVRRNIAGDLPEPFDVLFTWKNEPAPINVGFLAITVSSKVLEFMRTWQARTREIYTDAKLLEIARARNGAADQDAIWQMMGSPSVEELGLVRSIQFPFGSIMFRGAPCDVLNQTNSVPLSSPAAVFHYKGGWHPLLLRGRKFTSHRPRATSQAMYDLWFSKLGAEESALGMKLLPPLVRAKLLLRRLGLPV